MNVENADLRFSAVGSLEQITGGPAGRGDGIKYFSSSTTNIIRIKINQTSRQRFETTTNADPIKVIDKFDSN